jgi:chemotaxis signal transduction protein
MAKVDPKLRQRILRLERQVLKLRGHLREESEVLGEESFKVLEIRVGDTWYALQLAKIHEVVGMLWPQPLTDSPDWVLGTFLYGEEVVTLIDLRCRLEGEATELAPSAAVVLVHGDDTRLAGFAVRDIRQIFDIDPREVTAPNPDIPQAPYLLGSLRRDKRLLQLLSTERLSRELILDTEE